MIIGSIIELPTRISGRATDANNRQHCNLSERALVFTVGGGAVGGEGTSDLADGQLSLYSDGPCVVYGSRNFYSSSCHRF